MDCGDEAQVPLRGQRAAADAATFAAGSCHARAPAREAARAPSMVLRRDGRPPFGAGLARALPEAGGREVLRGPARPWRSEHDVRGRQSGCQPLDQDGHLRGGVAVGVELHQQAAAEVLRPGAWLMEPRRTDQMPPKRHKPEGIVAKLRQPDPLRRPVSRWRHDRCCTNIYPAPPNGG